MLNFCWVSTFFDILFFNVSWTVARTPIKNIVFWKSMMRSFRWIEKSCFDRLRFLAEFSTNLQKMHYFGQFKDHNSRRKKGNSTNDSIFLSTFWAVTVCDIHFCIWKLSKFIFMGVLLSSILVCKMPEFWRCKLWDQNFVWFNSGKIHLGKVKKQVLLFPSSWELNLSDLMIYFCLFQNAIL